MTTAQQPAEQVADLDYLDKMHARYARVQTAEFLKRIEIMHCHINAPVLLKQQAAAFQVRSVA